MTDTQVNVLTRLVPNGTAATIRVGPPVNRTYSSTVQSNSTSVTIPSAHMGDVAQANLTAEIVLPSETLTHTISIVKTDGKPVFGAITLNGNQLTINWIANNPARQFDVHLGSNPQPNDDIPANRSNDLGDSVGIGTATSHTFTISRTGVYTAYLRLRYSDNNWDDADTTVADGRYIDTTVEINIANNGYANTVDLSGSLVSQGSWNEAKWISIMGGLDTAYTPTNMDHLSLVDDGGARWIRQRHEAASNGSDRVIAPMELPALADHIIVEQTIMVANNFSWGTTSFSGKLGFGIGGGVNTTGGTVNPAGFTLRPSWDAGGELAMYSYAASRNSGNHDFGEEIGTGFYITTGVPFVLRYEVQINSATNQNDGWFKTWVNDSLVLDETGIGWMTSGTPKINRITWSQFHGGANSAWSPTETTYAQVSNISWETS